MSEGMTSRPIESDPVTQSSQQRAFMHTLKILNPNVQILRRGRQEPHMQTGCYCSPSQSVSFVL